MALYLHRVFLFASFVLQIVEFFECLLFDNVEWYFLLIKKQIPTVSVIRLIEN